MSVGLSVLLVALIYEPGTFGAQSRTASFLKRGKALFLGELPLQGQPRGHADPLPTQVVRCVNCHGTTAKGAAQLAPEYLLEPRSRHGGPPSAYDEGDFCKLLHAGVDPASVMIDRAMPVYAMPDSDCAALWAYITAGRGAHHAK